MITKANEVEIKNQIKPLVEKVNKIIRELNTLEKIDNKPVVTIKITNKPKKATIDKEKIDLLNEISKKIKIFTDLGLDAVDYIPIAENYENRTKEELEELNNLLDDELSSDQAMIEYIKENGGNADKYN